MAKGRTAVILMLLGSLWLIGCQQDKPLTVAAPAASVRPANQASAVAEAAPADFMSSGPIVVENQVDVAALRDGVVAQIQADTGARVRKGQLLAKLDDRQLEADREAAEAKIQSIGYDEKNWQAKVKMEEVDLDRAEKMFEAKLITQQMLDHQRFSTTATRNELQREREDYRNAQAVLKSLEYELEKTRIVAPFDGVVARRYVRLGQKVAKDDRLFWVTAEGPLRVKFTLPELFMGRLKLGDAVKVSSATGGTEIHAARVIQISPVVDPASGTIEVLAELLGSRGELRPGMSTTVRVEKRP